MTNPLHLRDIKDIKDKGYPANINNLSKMKTRPLCEFKSIV